MRAGALNARNRIARVHAVAPAGFDDPGRPTGGNIYDLRVFAGLAITGWDVRIIAVAGAWPAGDSSARAELAQELAAIPDGETVLIDGLIASPAQPSCYVMRGAYA